MPKSDDQGFGRDPDSSAAQASETPTPPVGLPLGKGGAAGQDADGPSDATPPIGVESVSGVVSAEDYGEPGPAVLGAEDAPETQNDAGDWPTLEYRSRNKQKRRSGGLGWLRRRRDSD